MISLIFLLDRGRKRLSPSPPSEPGVRFSRDVADWRLVANFWLRPGNTSSSNNVLAFIEATLTNLGATTVGLLRADSGFYDKTIVALLKGHKISRKRSTNPRLVTAS